MTPLPILKLVFAALVILFLLGPLIAVLPLSLTDSVFLNYPIPGYSTRWFRELVTADSWRLSIVNSLLIGAGTTALATLLGTLAALGLRGRRASLVFSTLRTVFLLPMVVPAVVLGVGMQLMFSRYGLTNTYLGVIIAHTVVAVPFVLVNVSSALQGVDVRLEQAAASLGAAPATVLFAVTLPIALPGIISGALFAFATSLDEVVLTLFVAGPNQRTLARQMFATIRENISPAIVSAAAVFIVGTIVLSLAMLAVRRRLA
ncbi:MULTISPECIES: ABC transporter permease [Bradyrhizobium]|jgi:putative spermidine/putrescine transport system permease protein|uniref:ABC transporter permease n=2 Tax=Bradyrhizobium TaxID=374 RepID=A0ABS5G596_9BRAD|nr:MULTISPECIES: ABC transporter permease [Bradyrhizobium]RTL92053.1 MAG: ABC transporter permease [Bradyrhizobiaceae bacterium]MBR1136488.1 ABC transporter permease [Bradyrhizobium denitrificans]MCL8485819.1 ABC transporter permease [Bradyrhizobium denitrificans]MDU0958736.1 ABC transporter permease [Bradyrhizobium sp.]MDU1496887.1 ABC transporter permease [Bradyrhizobium sp.]